MKIGWHFCVFNSLGMVSCAGVLDGLLQPGENSRAKSWWRLWLRDMGFGHGSFSSSDVEREGSEQDQGMEAVFFLLII